MHRYNQPIGIATDVEHDDRLPTAHMHHICATIATAHIGHVSPLRRPHCPGPRGQVLRCLWILLRCTEEFLFHYPHAHRMYANEAPLSINGEGLFNCLFHGPRQPEW